MSLESYIEGGFYLSTLAIYLMKYLISFKSDIAFKVVAGAACLQQKLFFLEKHGLQ